ncbi:MAG: tRNA pseudouridine(55) synthase TruB [Ornithinimicrobium sp.]
MSYNGLLLVDKDEGWTSHDVVAKTRRLCGTRRVGHAGTLDPMATGLLVLGVGKATRLLTFLVGLDKQYTATIRLGQATDTDDAQGQVVLEKDALSLTREPLAQASRQLIGSIDQVPSAVSAIKVKGKRAYARVRDGEDVNLAPRRVQVHRFDVGGLRPAGPDAPRCLDVDVSVEVSSGTYVRALARDIGEALGLGGHLVALRRLSVGPLTVERAVTVAALQETESAPVIDMAVAASAMMRPRDLDAEQERALRHGRLISADQPGANDLVAALGPDGSLVAILDESGEQARSRVVFPSD